MINEIILANPNQVHKVRVSEILNEWASGDYVTDSCDNKTHYLCFNLEYCYCAWQDGNNFKEKWMQVIDLKRQDEYYSTLYHDVLNKGEFNEVISAKISYEKKHIVLLDGHHRLSIAEELGYDEMDVYVGGETMSGFDLSCLDLAVQGW